MLKMKYIIALVALLSLTSCAPDTPPMPLSYVPIGVLILAFVGLVTVIFLAIGFVLLLGGLREWGRER